MNLRDYLIEQSGKDWTEMLAGWKLPESFELWMVNRFGDAFLVFEDGSVHMLDVDAGTLNRLADNRENFVRKAEQDDNAANWFMIPLTNDCVAAGLIPGPNQCYSFKVPPVLGGEYVLSNVVLSDLATRYSFLADIHAQTKDLPDGTQIRVVVGRKPTY